MEKITGKTELDRIFLYITERDGEDSIIQLVNFDLEEAIEEAKDTLRGIEPPASVEVGEDEGGEFLYTVSSYLDSNKNIHFNVQEK